MNLDHLKPENFETLTQNKKMDHEKKIDDFRAFLFEKSEELIKTFLKKQKMDYIKNIKKKTEHSEEYGTKNEYIN